MKAMLIPVFGEVREVVIPESGSAHLHALQNLVGGFIEYVPTKQNVTLYCNEEGKIARLSANSTATRAFGQFIEPDYFAGDVVVTGPLDEDGNTTSLDTVTWLAYVREWGI